MLLTSAIVVLVKACPHIWLCCSHVQLRRSLILLLATVLASSPCSPLPVACNSPCEAHLGPPGCADVCGMFIKITLLSHLTLVLPQLLSCGAIGGWSFFPWCGHMLVIDGQKLLVNYWETQGLALIIICLQSRLLALYNATRPCSFVLFCFLIKIWCCDVVISWLIFLPCVLNQLKARWTHIELTMSEISNKMISQSQISLSWTEHRSKKENLDILGEHREEKT